MRSFKFCSALGMIFLLASCSSVMKSEKFETMATNKEFEQSVKIVRTEEPPAEGAVPMATPAPTPAPVSTPVKSGQKTKTTKTTKVTKTAKVVKGKAAAKPVTPPAPVRRQPELEDAEGFAEGSRRPLVDPFTVGETVVHDVSYFKVSAGELRLSVKPFAYVNGRKSYNFVTAIKTVGVFSNFYSVDDWVETLVDFEQMIPSVFEMHVKETNQLRETKMLIDHQVNQAKFWERKVTRKDNSIEEKKYEWETMPFAQNVFSIFYYMRAFKWETGKEYSFPIAHEQENIIFKGTAIRREVLDTKLGPMKAIVIKPEITLKGNLKPIGDNFIWLSDDDNKYILRIESKIKIGTLVSQVIEIKK